MYIYIYITTLIQDESQRPVSSQGLYDFIKQTVPSAQLVEEVGTEITFTLPVDHGQIAEFGNLFNQIDENRSRLGIDKYGVSDGTLEEVRYYNSTS